MASQSQQVPSEPERGRDPAFDALAAQDLLRVTVTRCDDTVVLRVEGEIELATADRLADALSRQLSGDASRIVLDLRDVTFVDCAGVSVLIEATDRAVRETVRLQIRPGRALHRLSALLGLAGELNLLDDRR